MEPKELGAIFAQNVRRLLVVKDWSQNELARQLGVSSGVVVKMLSGTAPTGATIAKVSTLLEVQPHELLLPEAKSKKK